MPFLHYLNSLALQSNHLDVFFEKSKSKQQQHFPESNLRHEICIADMKPIGHQNLLSEHE